MYEIMANMEEGTRVMKEKIDGLTGVVSAITLVVSIVSITLFVKQIVKGE